MISPAGNALRRSLARKAASASGPIYPVELLELILSYQPRRYSSSYALPPSSASTYSPSATIPPLRLLVPAFFFSHTSDLPRAPSNVTLSDLTHRSLAYHHLLDFYENRERLSQVRTHVAPLLERLLQVGHYAGAREVLEAVFERHRQKDASKGSQGYGRLRLSTGDVNAILASLFGRPDSAKIATAPGKAFVKYLLRELTLDVDQVAKAVTEVSSARVTTLPISRESLCHLVRHTQFLDLADVRQIISLYRRMTEQERGRAEEKVDVALSHHQDSEILHGIMRVYAMFGEHEMARNWMEAINRLQEKSRPERPVEGSTSRSSSPSNSLRAVGRADQPHQSLLLGTTFLSSFRQPSPFLTSEPLDDSALHVIPPNEGHIADAQAPVGVDFTEAMAFFEMLRSPEWKDAPPKTLDIHAWTAVLAVAASDTLRVDAKALLSVVHRLRDDPQLPKPNAVTYTAVLNGLLRRDSQAEALRFFQSDILPAALDGKIEMDAALLQAVCKAWIDVGQLQRALDTVEWFCGKPDGEQSALRPEQPAAGSRRAAGKHAVLLPLPRTSPSLTARYSPLQGSVKPDTQLFNSLLVALAKAGHFSSLWNLYSSMDQAGSSSTSAYADADVRPDEVTLAILCKAAISAGKSWRRGSVPDRTEDTFIQRSRSTRRHGSGEDVEEVQRDWNGKKPWHYVRQVYWTMLEENFPLAIARAKDAVLTPTQRFFASSPLTARGRNASLVEDTGVGPSPYYALTPGLQSASHLRSKTSYPHLVPTPSNMHLLIALHAYFSASSEIPLLLACMRELHIYPARKTLCLALLAYEEGGAFSSDRRQFERFLRNWLGERAVPGDEELGLFRRKQW